VLLAGVGLEDGAIHEHGAQVNHLQLEGEEDHPCEHLLEEGVMHPPEFAQSAEVRGLLA